MPTDRDRIAVTKDSELATAMERVAALVPAGVKPATLVHDLASAKPTPGSPSTASATPRWSS